MPAAGRFWSTTPERRKRHGPRSIGKGIFPGAFNEDSEEERRLAYVALTRGKERVAISYCGYRRGGGTNGPNDYITDIPVENRYRGWLHQAAPVRPVRRSTFRDEMAALENARAL